MMGRRGMGGNASSIVSCTLESDIREQERRARRSYEPSGESHRFAASQFKGDELLGSGKTSSAFSKGFSDL